MSSTIARRRNTGNTPTPIITGTITTAGIMPSRRQLVAMRLTTSLVIIGLCIFAVTRGWSTAHFAMMQTTLGGNEANLDAVRPWIGAPGLNAAALRASLTQMTDVADI